MIDSAIIFPTLRCNMSCRYCFFRGLSRGVADMSPCTAKAALQFLEDHLRGSGSRVHFFGGEPLLRMDLIRFFVEGLSHRGVRFSITTNGSLATPEVVKFLREHDFGVLVSYDGIFGNLREGVSEEGVLRLLELNPTVAVQVSPDNVRYFARNVAYIISLGFRRVAINTVIDSYKPWNEDDYAAFQRELEKVVQLPARLSFVEAFEPFTCAAYPKFLRKRFRCGAGNRSVAIAPDGKLYPCQRLLYPEFEVGHVRTGIELARLRQIMKEFDECRNCWVEPCSPCYAANFEDTGDFYRINRAYCKLNKIKFEVVSALQ